MRELAVIVAIGLLGMACSHEAPLDHDGPADLAGHSGDVAKSSQFLASCSGSCPEPLSCVCGVCTLACTSDEACTQYSGNATCVAPSSESDCQSAQRSCDVRCTHDTICEPLEGDFVCLVGRCRRQVESTDHGNGADGGSSDGGSWDSGSWDSGSSDTPLAACEPHAPIAGLCVLPIEGSSSFNNDNPSLGAKIVAIGDAEARPECFGSDNFGHAIPVAAHAGETPTAPEGAVWWRIDDGSAVSVVALAAPGLDALGVKVGDSVSFHHAVSWGGWDWPFGNAEVDIAGRGHVLIAVNDSSQLDVSDGPASCELAGACGGQEWSMRITVNGEQISVPPFGSVKVGNSLFANGGALTHRPEYHEPDETTEGTPGCKGEPRTNFIATRVDAL